MSYKFTYTLSFFLILITSYNSIGQTFNGRVLNNEKQPLENVYVYNKTSNSHTHTKIDGSFILEKSSVGNSIEIGLLGYEKKTIILNNNHFNDKNVITLTSKTFLLDELELTKKLNISQTIVAVDIAKNPVNSSCKEVCEKNTHVSQKKLHPNTEQYFSRYSQDDFFHNWLNPSFQTRKPLSEQDVSDLLFQRDKRKDWF